MSHPPAYTLTLAALATLAIGLTAPIGLAAPIGLTAPPRTAFAVSVPVKADAFQAPRRIPPQERLAGITLRGSAADGFMLREVR